MTHDLIVANTRLVGKIALAYRGLGLEMDDLIGEGNLGLVKAAQRYDPGRGVKFSTYAAFWIKQAIRDALTKSTATIRIPDHTVKLICLWRKLGCTPSMSHRQLALVKQALRTQRWQANGLENATTQQDSQATLDNLEELDDLLARLDAHRRLILTLRYGLNQGWPQTLKQVSRQLGISPQRINFLERQTIQMLQADIKE